MDNQGITVSHLLGEVTWLFTQSPIHKALPIAALDSLAMPAILNEQLFVFRDGDRPVGVALWAYCSEAAEKKLHAGVLTKGNMLTLDDWKSGDKLWLVDLVAPFSNERNRQADIMMADLVSGPLKGKAFSYHRIDKTGKREVVEVAADAGEQLAAAIKAASH
ncbi:MAG: toxin-activating lysine-acyltransferase [Parasphingopyxis sp.]|uniref:toxin-activating lysine-acyltransferase n=1 Tax=Parasphingopyxis sp. TaxID=1920299 RepID=UPI003F9EDE19